MKSIPLLLFLLLALAIQAQTVSSADKSLYQWGIDAGGGTTFPNFPRDQEYWRAGAYPAGMVSLFVSKRLSPRLSAEVHGGLTGYSLINVSKNDRYVLDFTTPFLRAGIGYRKETSRKHDLVVRTSAGMQMGSSASYIDQEKDYSVLIEGSGSAIPFVRADMGIHRTLPKCKKVNNIQLTYELTVFYRHNLNRMGTVRFVTEDYDVTIRPRGSIMGISARVFFPLGKMRYKAPEKEPEPPTHKPRSPRTL